MKAKALSHIGKLLARSLYGNRTLPVRLKHTTAVTQALLH
jgi:hypothetical protein